MNNEVDPNLSFKMKIIAKITVHTIELRITPLQEPSDIIIFTCHFGKSNFENY